MAQLQSTVISGSVSFQEGVPFKLPNTEITSSVGYVWYDTSANQLKISRCVPGVGAWSAGGALSNSDSIMSGLGTQDAALAIRLNCTEEYDGSSWSAQSARINSTRPGEGSTGVVSAGMVFGGSSPNNVLTEEYNGSSWSSGGNMIASRQCHAGFGTQNGTFSVGHQSSPGCRVGEEYNGSTWTAGPAFINGRWSHAASGTSVNAGLAFGGSPTVTCSEEYNGTSWSTTSGLNSGRRYIGGEGAQGSTIAMGGFTNVTCTNLTEEYDGLTWTARAGFTTPGNRMGSAGDSSLASLAIGGGCRGTCTEEYTTPQFIATGSLSFT